MFIMPYPNHATCHNLNVVETEIFKNSDSNRVLISMYCSGNLFSFTTINGYKLYQIISHKSNHYCGSSEKYSTKTWSKLKPEFLFSVK